MSCPPAMTGHPRHCMLNKWWAGRIHRVHSGLTQACRMVPFLSTWVYLAVTASCLTGVENINAPFGLGSSIALSTCPSAMVIVNQTGVVGMNYAFELSLNFKNNRQSLASAINISLAFLKILGVRWNATRSLPRNQGVIVS